MLEDGQPFGIHRAKPETGEKYEHQQNSNVSLEWQLFAIHKVLLNEIYYHCKSASSGQSEGVIPHGIQKGSEVIKRIRHTASSSATLLCVKYVNAGGRGGRRAVTRDFAPTNVYASRSMLS